MSRLGSRAKQTQKSDLSDRPFPAGKFGCLEVAFPMAKSEQTALWEPAFQQGAGSAQLEVGKWPPSAYTAQI